MGPEESVSPESEPGRRLQPPRFGLAALMLFVTVLGGLFALINAVGAHSALWLTILFLAVVAHVLGNSLGTRLRGSPAVPLTGRARVESPPFERSHFSPATQLSDRKALGWGVVALTTGGALIGAACGWCGFRYWYADEITVLNLLFGACASGMLSGFLAFAAASMLKVLWGAWSQAVREP